MDLLLELLLELLLVLQLPLLLHVLICIYNVIIGGARSALLYLHDKVHTVAQK